MLFRERKQIAICITAGAVVTAFVLFCYRPLRQRIKAVEQTKAAQTLAITKASMERAQMPVIREQLLKLQRTVGNYKANIPAQNDFGVFLQQIAEYEKTLDFSKEGMNLGWSWRDVRIQPAVLNRFFLEGYLENPFKSNSYTGYLLS